MIGRLLPPNRLNQFETGLPVRTGWDEKAGLLALHRGSPDIFFPAGKRRITAEDQGDIWLRRKLAVGTFRTSYVFRGALGYYLAAAFPALRAQVDDPVGGLDHFGLCSITEGAAVVDQAFECCEQLCDVVEMQAGGWLVADEERAFVGCLRQMRG